MGDQANAMEMMDQTIRGPLRMEIQELMVSSLEVSSPPEREKGSNEQPLSEHAAWLLAQKDPWLSQVVRYVTQQSSANLEAIELVRLLREVVIFQGIPSRELSYMAAKLRKVHAPKGAVVIQEGEAGDSLFILATGQVGVYDQDRRMSLLQPGACFGEMAVLTSGLRTAMVKAEVGVLLWELDGSVLFDTMFNHPLIALEMMRLLSQQLRSLQGEGEDELTRSLRKRNEVAATDVDINAEGEARNVESILRKILVLQKIEIFTYLDTNDYMKLARAAEEVEYQAGEMICRAGEYGDTMYGILEGRVQVQRGGEQLAILHEGESFGEMAIIDNRSRSADCISMERTRLLHIHRDHIVTLCFQNIDVLKSMLRVLAERLLSARNIRG